MRNQQLMTPEMFRPQVCQSETVREVVEEAFKVVSSVAQEGDVGADEVEAIRPTVVTTSANEQFLPSKIDQHPLYHLHLALAGEAALVVA